MNITKKVSHGVGIAIGLKLIGLGCAALIKRQELFRGLSNAAIIAISSVLIISGSCIKIACILSLALGKSQKNKPQLEETPPKTNIDSSSEEQCCTQCTTSMPDKTVNA